MLTSRLKEARLRAGLSQERLGTLAGLDEMSASSRMNQYERGKHTPGFFLIERLAQALNIPTPWFYTRDDDLADLLLAYNALPAHVQRKVVAYVKSLAAENQARDGVADPLRPAVDGDGHEPDNLVRDKQAANARNVDGHAANAGDVDERPVGGDDADDERGQPARHAHPERDGQDSGVPETASEPQGRPPTDGEGPDGATYSRSSPGRNRSMKPAPRQATDGRNRK